jgi:hypothetical protein
MTMTEGCITFDCHACVDVLQLRNTCLRVLFMVEAAYRLRQGQCLQSHNNSWEHIAPSNQSSSSTPIVMGKDPDFLGLGGYHGSDSGGGACHSTHCTGLDSTARS